MKFIKKGLVRGDLETRQAPLDGGKDGPEICPRPIPFMGLSKGRISSLIKTNFISLHSAVYRPRLIWIVSRFFSDNEFLRQKNEFMFILN